MDLLARWLKAVYNFLVGDMYILLGTLATLVVAVMFTSVSPSGAGLLFFGLLAGTLTLALRRELVP